MSEKSKETGAKKPGKGKEPTYTIEGTPWANAWKIAGGLGGVFLVVSMLGLTMDAKRFAFSYLFAFVVFLTVALGSIFFILINRLTSAGWSVTVRRTAEFFGVGLVVFPVLFIPILLSTGHLFPWWNEGHHEGGGEHAAIAIVSEAHAQEHAAPAGHGAPAPAGAEHAAPAGEQPGHGQKAGLGHGDHHSGQEAALHQAHATTLAAKTAYLNKSFFYVRAAIYLAVWCLLGWWFLTISTRQDTTKDPKDTVTAQKFSPLAAWGFGLTLTFSMFDWVMSLEPAWFSTIFGVYIFSCSAVAAMAVLTFVLLLLKDGPLKGMVNVEHFHDMGKILFGFNGFWAYIGFSQYMLIWYAGLPEETTWYHTRGLGPAEGSWRMISIGLMAAHFIIPFFMLISRHAKRNLDVLKFGAVWLFIVHIVDIYWFVLPNYSKELTPHWLDITCLLGVGGAYLGVVFYFMGKHQLVPVGDPRLKRALAFEQA